MKKVFILVFIFLLTGCSSEYTLEFSNSKIKEHSVITINNSEIPSDGKTVDNFITPLLEEDQYPFFGKYDKVYNKKIEKKDNNTIVKLNYSFTHDEFKDSYVYKGCFKNSQFEKNDKDYLLHFYGHFYCLKGDELVINIKTNNIVKEHNADKVSGNVYTWIINKDNVLNSDIKMVISKDSKILVYVKYGIAIIFFAVIIIGSYIIYSKIKVRDKVNDI